MRFEFGAYQHEIGGVFISSDSRRINRSPRGQLLSTVRRLDISGTLIADNQNDITAAMAALALGYRADSNGGGLLQDDGTQSHHYLQNAGSLAGVQVVDGPNWGTSNGNGEYATGRTFSISLEAEYPASQTNPIVAFREVVASRGSGGPEYVTHAFLDGPPVIEQVKSLTPVVVTQQGQATGYRGFPPHNTPMFGLGAIQGPGVVRSRTSPERSGDSFINYTVSWSYEFHSVGSVDPQPTIV